MRYSARSRLRLWPGAVPVLIAVLLAAVLVPAGPARSEPVFPALTGRIVDEAGLLPAADRIALEAELAAIESKSTDQVVVVTLTTLQGYDISDYGYRLGRHWGIGQKGKDNGILLIVAPNERLVRIEVGRGLEGIITDGLASGIVQTRILPAFRRGDFPGGIRAGVEDIRDALLGDIEEVKRRVGEGGGQGSFDWTALVFLLVWLAIFVFMVWRAHRDASDPRRARARRRRTGLVVGPGGSGSSGGWSSGGWSSGSGGSSGGWSGGGGSFGGGGASGKW